MAKTPKVALFATCLVDSMRPSVGFAAIKLLQAAGCEVHVPKNQTCCGQPAYNSGDNDGARAILTPLLDEFIAYDYIVIPSASCAGMLKKHLPVLFPETSDKHKKALAFADKAYELIYFLSHVVKLPKPPKEASGKRFLGRVAYHASCSSLREVGLRDEPKKMIKSLPHARYCDIEEAEVCCGFGGMFCMKYAPISAAMVENKCRHISQAAPDILLSGDLGCLLNIAGKLSKDGSPIKAYHIAEALADMCDRAAIGDKDAV